MKVPRVSFNRWLHKAQQSGNEKVDAAHKRKCLGLFRFIPCIEDTLSTKASKGPSFCHSRAPDHSSSKDKETRLFCVSGKPSDTSLHHGGNVDDGGQEEMGEAKIVDNTKKAAAVVNGGQAKTKGMGKTKSKVNKEELQEQLKELELSRSGNKDALISRLNEHARNLPASAKQEALIQFLKHNEIFDDGDAVVVSESSDSSVNPDDDKKTKKSDNLTIARLKELLKENRLPLSGNKEELKKRLEENGIDIKPAGSGDRADKSDYRYGVLCTSETFLGSDKEKLAAHFSLYGANGDKTEESEGNKASTQSSNDDEANRQTSSSGDPTKESPQGERKPEAAGTENPSCVDTAKAADPGQKPPTDEPVPYWLRIHRDSQEPLGTLYRELYEWQQLNRGVEGDLIFGFGHAHLANSKTHEAVSGPIGEIRLEVFLLDDGIIEVRPRAQSGVRMNTEVMAALMVGENKQCKAPTFVEDLHHFFADQNALDLVVPGDPKGSYLPLLKELATRISYNGTAMSTNDFLSADPVVDQVVLSDAWCIYTRPKTTSPVSLDATRIADALAEDKINPPLAALAITHGPEALKNRLVQLKAKYQEQEKDQNIAKVDPKQIVFPLPASDVQREIVEKLLVEHFPVCLVQGPPGTGKTHTIALVIAAFLCEGKRCLVQALTVPALRAVWERLPCELRKFCVMATGGDAGSELLNSLEDLDNALSRVQRNSRLYKEDLKTFESELEAKRQRRGEIDEKLRGVSGQMRDFNSSNDGRALWERLSSLTASERWMATVSLKWSEEELDCVIQRVRQLITRQESLRADTGVSGEPKRDLVEAAQMGLEVAKFNQAVCAFRDEVGATLINFGCPEEALFAKAEDGCGMVISDRLLQTLEDARKLMGAVKEAEEKADVSIRTETGSGFSLEAERHALSTEIQQLELKAVELKVLLKMNENISDDQRSNLTSFVMLARNDKFGASTQDELQYHFESCASFIPCLMMPTEQVSKNLSPIGHPFDLVILEEASQSRCNALVGLIRGSQWMVVGDGKQVSPTMIGVSSEKTSSLAGMAPALPPNIRKRLKPNSSIFDVFEVAYPWHARFKLLEHFRCAPELIHWCNKHFYHGELIPLRYPTSKERIIPSLVDIPVGGERDSKTKTNQAEVEAIVRLVQGLVAHPLIVQRQRPIGIVSLGGPEQCKQLEKSLHERVGAHVFQAHKLMIGDPATFQGAERDIMIKSMVYSPDSNNHHCNPDQDKRLNVAMSRGRDCNINVRSVDAHDYKAGNLRGSLIDEFKSHSTISDSSSHPPVMRNLTPAATPSSHRAILTKLLAEEIEKKGFTVQCINVIWKHAFVAEHPQGDSRVAICLANIDESEKGWEEMTNRQRVMERVGWKCLRVDGLSILMDFQSAVKEILSLLSDSTDSACNRENSGSSALPSGDPTDITDLIKKLTLEISGSARPSVVHREPSPSSSLSTMNDEDMTEVDQPNNDGTKRPLEASLESSKRPRN